MKAPPSSASSESTRTRTILLSSGHSGASNSLKRWCTKWFRKERISEDLSCKCSHHHHCLRHRRHHRHSPLLLLLLLLPLPYLPLFLPFLLLSFPHSSYSHCGGSHVEMFVDEEHC